MICIRKMITTSGVTKVISVSFAINGRRGIMVYGINDDEVGDVVAVGVGAAARFVADVNGFTASAIVQACATPGVVAVA